MLISLIFCFFFESFNPHAARAHRLGWTTNGPELLKLALAPFQASPYTFLASDCITDKKFHCVRHQQEGDATLVQHAIVREPSQGGSVHIPSTHGWKMNDHTLTISMESRTRNSDTSPRNRTSAFTPQRPQPQIDLSLVVQFQEQGIG